MSEGHRVLGEMDISKDIIVMSEEEFNIASRDPMRIFFASKMKAN
jgi:hypothetical protein